MKLKTEMTKILTNKYVLHVVFFIAFINMLFYVTTGNIDAVVYFILLGFLGGNVRPLKYFALIVINCILYNYYNYIYNY